MVNTTSEKILGGPRPTIIEEQRLSYSTLELIPIYFEWQEDSIGWSTLEKSLKEEVQRYSSDPDRKMGRDYPTLLKYSDGKMNDPMSYASCSLLVNYVAESKLPDIKLGCMTILRDLFQRFTEKDKRSMLLLSMIADVCTWRINRLLSDKTIKRPLEAMDDFSLLIVRSFCLEEVKFSDKKKDVESFYDEFKKRDLDKWKFDPKSPFNHIAKFCESSIDDLAEIEQQNSKRKRKDTIQGYQLGALGEEKTDE